ncbi:MAG: peptidylprolyl isomerase [Bacilli bacterium]|nr:peptidylprolyl isomerase [Bacilli bacterium]
MKKKIIVLALCMILLSGCGSKIPKLANGDEAVVTLKDGEMIGVGDLYTEMKDQYAMDILINMVDKNILEKAYSDRLEDATNYVESYMTQLESAYGDQLEEAISYYTNYKTIEAFKDSVYIDYLRQIAIEDYCKKQITDKEIEKYYDEEIVGDIKVSHILITANVTDDMTDEEKKTAETEAKEKIEAIITELKKTKKEEVADKFVELAKEQSNDASTKDNGGSLGFINKDTLSDSYDELVTAAYKLKDGEYSTSVITTELGYHVILRTETKEKASLEDVKDSIIESLATTYLEENPVAQVKGLQEIRDEYEMEIQDTDIKAKYAESIQSQITYYTTENEENKEQ